MRSALAGGILLFVVLASILILAGVFLPKSPLGRIGLELTGELVLAELACLVLLFCVIGEDQQHN